MKILKFFFLLFILSNPIGAISNGELWLNDICPICFNKVSNDMILVVLCCKHCMHYKCVAALLMIPDFKCPLCRKFMMYHQGSYEHKGCIPMTKFTNH